MKPKVVDPQCYMCKYYRHSLWSLVPRRKIYQHLSVNNIPCFICTVTMFIFYKQEEDAVQELCRVLNHGYCNLTRRSHIDLARPRTPAEQLPHKLLNFQGQSLPKKRENVSVGLYHGSEVADEDGRYERRMGRRPSKLESRYI